jgi:UDP-GlcNAc:undecaprenyl-phosphate GlcNAc-1-phosphate transferase
MFEADRDHVHHRLLLLGLTQRAAVLRLYALASGLSLLAIIVVVSQYRNAGAILLTVVIATYVGIRKLGYEEIALVRASTLLQWGERMILTRVTSIAFMDIALITTAYWASFALKYDGVWTSGITRWYLVAFPFVLIIQISVFLGLGLYRGISRAMGVADLLSLGLAVAVSVLLSHVVSVIYAPPSGIASFFGIDWVLLQILVFGGRSARIILTYLRRQGTVTKGVHVLIYGVGRRGESIQRELLENRGLDMYPIGFLDDDQNLLGLKINGVQVLGSSRDLATIINSQKVSAVIISTHKIPAERLVPVTDLCSEQRIPVLRCELQLDRLSCVGSSWAREIAERRDQLETGLGVVSARENPDTAKVASP